MIIRPTIFFDFQELIMRIKNETKINLVYQESVFIAFYYCFQRNNLDYEEIFLQVQILHFKNKCKS